MSPVTAFTSVTLAYLDRAVVMRDSLREFHPDWDLVLVLVDEIPDSEPILAELARFDRVLLASEFRGKDFRGWIFGHDVVEACTAVKGLAAHYLMHHSPGPVVYLDPDMMLFASLDPAIDAISRGGIGLTPHILTPQRTSPSVIENEMGALKRGVYNLGFLALSKSGSGPAFARWWRQRLDKFCIDDVPAGLFIDRRMVDFAPVFFPDTVVLRDPGLSVGSWNLAEREISLSASGDYLVNGVPLRLFHFTKALGDGPRVSARWAADNIHVAEIWRYYLAQLGAVHDRLPATGWAYAAYTNGDSIPLEHRRRYRQDPSVRARFPDPFAMADRERPTG
jgi:hypothetical protein